MKETENLYENERDGNLHRKATRGTSSVLDKDARHNLTMEVPIPFVFIEVLRFLHNR